VRQLERDLDDSGVDGGRIPVSPHPFKLPDGTGDDARDPAGVAGWILQVDLLGHLHHGLQVRASEA
jgi:hypothetical protein